MDPVSPVPSPDSAQELSPAEIQVVKDALPQPPQTIPVRISSIEADIAALKADLAAAIALVKQSAADIGKALADVQGDIAALKALAPVSVGDKLKAFEGKIEGKIAGVAAALEQHFNIKL